MTALRGPMRSLYPIFPFPSLLFVLVLILAGIILLYRPLSPSPLGTPTPTSPPPPTPTSWPRVRLESPGYGMVAFLWWREEVADRDLNLVRDAGFTWVRQNLHWVDVELYKGGFDWRYSDRIVRQVQERGLNLLFRLHGLPRPGWVSLPDDPALPVSVEDFADFCGAVAARYRGQVRAYQVWNEPNLAREWEARAPNPEGYVRLLRACYIAIKEADPDALVVSAGMAPTGTGLPIAMPDTDYFTAMYEAGAAPYFDLLGVHAAGFAAPPEVSPEEAATNPAYGGQRFFCFRHVEDIREIMVRYGDGEKQVAVTEMGWTSDPVHPEYSWFAVTEEQKADYLVRAFRYARDHWQPWIGPMFVLSIADHDWTPDEEQYWWAITEPGWPLTVVRPAYEALKDMEK
jgi:hypothetical protein